MYSMPELFLGRKVIHFIDNAPSLSNLVNGYSGQPDLAMLVNMHHIACLALRVDWYGAWVPSKANLGDIMTRPDRYHELLEGLMALPEELRNEIFYVDLELPPVGDSINDLKEWMRVMRALADKAVKDKEERRKRNEA